MEEYNKLVSVNERKSVAISSFKNKVWIHIRDGAKHVSFVRDDFIELEECLEQIHACIKECDKFIRLQQRMKSASEPMEECRNIKKYTKRAEPELRSKRVWVNDSDAETPYKAYRRRITDSPPQ